MNRIYRILLFWLGFYQSVAGQSIYPSYNPEKVTIEKDWLVDLIDAKAQLTQTENGYLVLSNGLVSRTFTTYPNGATVGLDLLTRNESFLRSVRPEAEVEIDGIKFSVGGLTGQPIHNYLLPEWINEMKADPASFKFIDYHLESVKERFAWKKRSEWMSKDMPWPLPGKELIFNYRLDDLALQNLKLKSSNLINYQYLKDIIVEVHYELYDGMPVFSKWIEVHNHSGVTIRVNTFKSEILAVPEAESVVDSKIKWELPNITVETDYNFGGMSNESIFQSSVSWNIDTLYQTQVNYKRETPCLLETYPKYGPDQKVESGQAFLSFRTWELIHDSRDLERKGLEYRRFMRAMSPWATENPILMHVRSATDEAVRKAIDQCAEVGFEMVIMTFGSGFDAEDNSLKNVERMKKLANYAHSKGIALGGYSLLASRSVDAENDVVMPEGMTPRFGNSPCLESEWGQDYFKKLYRLFGESHMDVLEHDGSYPGDVCVSANHPGHKGLADSQWNQYKRITDFYKWCRSQGIYLNVPDYYFLSGSSKTGMGYRETNWSLPREQQEIIERQNIYDGTWSKTPAMGWMFVPLVEYQGGGEAATIEPLKEHLPHYGQRLANLLGNGVQACYRGPQLYDAPETEELVRKWVSFYKLHRQILDGDIIHVRRADGRDYDAMLHVDPQGEEKGLLMIYNPLNETIKRKIPVNLYYTGLKTEATVIGAGGETGKLMIDRDYNATIDVEIMPKSQTWLIFK